MLPLAITSPDGTVKRLPKKQACLSAFLVLAGMTCVNEGIVQDSTALIILGIGVLLPGGWSAFVIIQTLRQQPGYSFEQLPNYSPDE